MNGPIPLLVEGRPQRQFVDAIFQELIQAGMIRTVSYHNRDSALGVAESFLLRNPDRFVAIVLETRATEPWKISEFDLAVRRRVLKFIPNDNLWHIAMAVPDLKAWALIDDHIRHEYEKIHQDPATASTCEDRVRIELSKDPATASTCEDRVRIELSNYTALASKLGEWVAAQAFDLDALKQKSRQVRELCAFIEKSLRHQPEPAPITTADWF
jgi:hypothetical protein